MEPGGAGTSKLEEAWELEEATCSRRGCELCPGLGILPLSTFAFNPAALCTFCQGVSAQCLQND